MHRDRKIDELVVTRERRGGLCVYGGREVVDFTSWDILGIGKSPAVLRALVQAVDTLGTSSHSSRRSSGSDPSHMEFESRFAKFFGREAGLLFPTRNQCVLSTVTTLFSEGDVVYYEESMEAPVVDACALIGINALPFHSASLGAVSEDSMIGKSTRKIGLFIESVSAVTGQTCHLEQAILFSARVGALLFLDDTAGVGICGARGAVDLPGFEALSSKVVRFCSLTHGLGIFGAALCGPQKLISAVMDGSKNFAVEHPLPPFIVRAAIEALDYAELQLLSRQVLKEKARLIAMTLSKCGFEAFSESPIVTVCFPSFREAKGFRAALLERNLLVEAFTAPLKRKERGVIRILPSLLHSDRQIAELVDGFEELRRRSGAL